MKSTRNIRTQSGAALFMALIFLIIITTLSLAAMRSSVMELRMAGNSEAAANAIQKAQSIIDATISNTDNTPVVGNIGDTTCLAGSATACTRYSVILNDAAVFATELAAGEIDVVVKRMSPLSKPAPRATGYSIKGYNVATFEVSGEYDTGDAGLGAATIVEGALVLITK